MSLLDDASIVVTPNGYKQGVLFSVIPSSGAADLEVTRGTAATRVDEDGLVNYAEVLGSEEIDNGGFSTNLDYWSTSSWWVWNSLGAYHPSTSSHKPLYQQCCVIGKTYLITFDLNCIGSSQAKFSLGSSTGSTTQVIGTSLTSGSYSYFVTAAAEYIVFNRQNTAEYYVNNVSVKEVTRDNVPRIDYTGGGCPHILAEPMRTNLVTYSEDFSQWNKGDLTISSDAIVSPDGTQNADTLNVIDANDFIYEGATTTASTEYVFTFYVKRGTIAESSLKLAIYDDTNNAFIVSNISYSASDSEWTRVTQSFTTPVGCILIRAYAFRNTSTTLGTFSVWGAQLELGSYATSYIPTSGSTVTRNQDIFTRDGIGSLINDTEGVLFLEMAAFSNDTNSVIISINDDSLSNSVAIYYYSNANNVAANIFNGGNAPSLIGTIPNSGTKYDFNKIALKYKSGDSALWVNGVEIFTLGDSISLTGLNKISFDYGNGSFPFYGKVKQLQVYNTALSDEQLLQLTGESGTDFYESYAEMASALTYTIQ